LFWLGPLCVADVVQALDEFGRRQTAARVDLERPPVDSRDRPRFAREPGVNLMRDADPEIRTEDQRDRPHDRRNDEQPAEPRPLRPPYEDLDALAGDGRTN